jgi:predicted nucleic acid-binding OB-fold protein
MIEGCGHGCANAIIHEREKGLFKTKQEFDDRMKGCGIAKKVTDALKKNLQDQAEDESEKTEE